MSISEGRNRRWKMGIGEMDSEKKLARARKIVEANEDGVMTDAERKENL